AVRTGLTNRTGGAWGSSSPVASSRRTAGGSGSNPSRVAGPASASRSRCRPMADTIRVLLVDDHALFADGLRLLLAGEPDREVAAIAPDANEAMRLCEELRPDVVLMDIDLPG